MYFKGKNDNLKNFLLQLRVKHSLLMLLTILKYYF